MYNMNAKTGMDKIFTLFIGPNETLREYTDRWVKICQPIGKVDPIVVFNCYKYGLARQSRIFEEFCTNPPIEKKGELRIIQAKYIHLEEMQRDNLRNIGKSQGDIAHRTHSVEPAKDKGKRPAEPE